MEQNKILTSSKSILKRHVKLFNNQFKNDLKAIKVMLEDERKM